MSRLRLVSLSKSEKRMALSRIISMSLATEQLPVCRRNDFGGRAPGNAETREILVFGNERKAMRLCVLPNEVVRSAGQSSEVHMGRIGKQVGKVADKPSRKILVSEKPQGLQSFQECWRRTR